MFVWIQCLYIFFKNNILKIYLISVTYKIVNIWNETLTLCIDSFKVQINYLFGLMSQDGDFVIIKLSIYFML